MFSDDVRAFPVFSSEHPTTPITSAASPHLSLLTIDSFESWVKWLLTWHIDHATTLSDNEHALIKERLRKLHNKSSARKSRRMSKCRNETLDKANRRLLAELSARHEEGFFSGCTSTRCQEFLTRIKGQMDSLNVELSQTRTRVDTRLDQIQERLDTFNVLKGDPPSDSVSGSSDEEDVAMSVDCVFVSSDVDTLRRSWRREKDKAHVDMVTTLNDIQYYLDNVLDNIDVALFQQVHDRAQSDLIRPEIAS